MVWASVQTGFGKGLPAQNQHYEAFFYSSTEDRSNYIKAADKWLKRSLLISQVTFPVSLLFPLKSYCISREHKRELSFISSPHARTIKDLALHMTSVSFPQMFKASEEGT